MLKVFERLLTIFLDKSEKLTVASFINWNSNVSVRTNSHDTIPSLRVGLFSRSFLSAKSFSSLLFLIPMRNVNCAEPYWLEAGCQISCNPEGIWSRNRIGLFHHRFSPSSHKVKLPVLGMIILQVIFSSDTNELK